MSAGRLEAGLLDGDDSHEGHQPQPEPKNEHHHDHFHLPNALYILFGIFSVVESYLSVTMAAQDPIPDLFNTTGLAPLESDLVWNSNSTGASYFADSFRVPVRGYDNLDPVATGVFLFITGTIANFSKLTFIKDYFEHLPLFFKHWKQLKLRVRPLISMASALYLACDVAAEATERFDSLSVGVQSGLGFLFALSWLSQNWFAVSAEWLEKALGEDDHDHDVFDTWWKKALFIIGSLCGLTDFMLTGIRLLNGGWAHLGTVTAIALLSLTSIFEVADVMRGWGKEKEQPHSHDVEAADRENQEEGNEEDKWFKAKEETNWFTRHVMPLTIPQYHDLHARLIGFFWTGLAFLVVGHFCMMTADFLVVEDSDPGQLVRTGLGLASTLDASIGEVSFHSKSWAMMVAMLASACCRPKRRQVSPSTEMTRTPRLSTHTSVVTTAQDYVPPEATM